MEGVTVKRLKSDEKRRWNKKHYCVFCRRPQVKIARHLLRKHADEEDVAAANELPAGSKQRHLLLDHLRCKGNYLHNIEVRGLCRRRPGNVGPVVTRRVVCPSGDSTGQRRDHPVATTLGGRGRKELSALPAVPRLLPPRRPLEASGVLSEEDVQTL